MLGGNLSEAFNELSEVFPTNAESEVVRGLLKSPSSSLYVLNFQMEHVP